MLHNVDRFKTDISKILEQKRKTPDLELEWRLGTIENGRFTSRVFNVDRLLDKYKFIRSSYTVILYENGIRVRDGKSERKKRISTVDLAYMPIAVRLALNSEEPGVLPGPNEIPTGTREIERLTCIIGSAELMVSQINGQWEVEIEFTETPRSLDDMLKPIEEVLNVLMPDRPNMLSVDYIRDVTKNYHAIWHDRAESGFLRRVGYKPLNFIESDCDLLLNGSYAISNKLDGVRYVIMSHLKKLYIVNDTDGMYMGDGDLGDHLFDGEWDPHDHTFHVWDYQTRDRMGYPERVQIVQSVIHKLAIKSIVCKDIIFPGKSAIYKATMNTIASMRKRYGKDWTDRNDGIIYTPANESYLGGKDRSQAVLKWKFPDHISVDLRLRKVDDHYEAYAQDRDGETLIRGIVIHDDKQYDGMIVEVGLDQGKFYVMRPRPDKVTANFITVVTETLKDMRAPFTLDQLLAKLKGKHGGEKDLISAPSDEMLAEARKYVEGDRREFEKLYRVVIEYASTHKLRLSNPECLLKTGTLPQVINLYTVDGLRTSNDLANKLFDHTHIIFMKTNIPFMEFEISALNRTIVRIYAYPRVRHIRTEQLFRSIPLKLVGYDVETLHEEIELIEIYHRLYMPFPERWDDARELEWTLWQPKGGASKPHDREKSDFAKRVREALYDSLEFNDLGILVGHWGYHELAKGSLPSYDKVQLLSTLSPDELKTRVENILRDVTPVKLDYKTEEVSIPHDMHLRRTIYYFDWKGKRTALFDSFNSLDYELVPTVTGRGKKLRVGNPYVLQRFFLIDLWMLSVLAAGGYITKEMASQKSTVLMDRVRALRADEYVTMCGGDEYQGVYKDLAIERRRVLKQEEKFRPYKPLEHFERFGKLRQMQSQN